MNKYKLGSIFFKYGIFVFISSFIFIFSAYCGYFLGFIIYKIDFDNDVHFLDNDDFYELPSQIFDQKGRKLGSFYLYNRDLVHYRDIPQMMIDILLLIEDNRFYKHYGIDLYGITRAFIKNLLSWDIVEGGSTIHQQLSKLVFTNSERTYTRKIFDIWFALQLEKRYSKEEILEKYLNYIYFGHGIYGIKMASQFYFNKNLKALSIAEIVFLISLIPAPNRYSPLVNPKQSKKRHSLSFNILIKNNYLSAEEAAKHIQYFWEHFDKILVNIKSNKNFFYNKNDYAPYFREYIRKKLENDFLREHLEKYIRKQIKIKNLNIENDPLNKKVEQQLRNYLFTGGFKIYTSLDLEKHRLAKSIFLETLNHQSTIFFREHKSLYQGLQSSELDLIDFLGLSFLSDQFQFRSIQNRKKLLHIFQKEFEYLKVLPKAFNLPHLDLFFETYFKNSKFKMELNLIQGAWLILNTKNSYLEVMLGGHNFYQNQFNRSFALRQPGSVFKIILYAIAFENGYHPKSLFIDDKIVFYHPITGKLWAPHNADKIHYGKMNLETAFKHSINTIAIQLAKKIGLKKIIFYLNEIFDLNNERFKEINLSIALGTLEMTPMEMLQALSIIMNDGFKIEPISILRIETKNSQVLYDVYEDPFFNKKKRIFSKRTCTYMKKIMQKVILEGTGLYAYKNNPLKGNLYGKTGTSQENRDLWFVGGNMNILSSIWLGVDRGLISLGNKWVSGNVLVPMWLKFMHYMNTRKR